jgi:uncharacterized protein
MKLPVRATAFVHRFLIAGLILASLSVSTIPAHAVTVEEIPRPTGWVVDQTGTLPAEALEELNRLGDEVKAKTGAELAVVVVGTTNGVEPREFATRLFNHWGISERDKNNGLLVFAALDDRAAEIVLGDGVDDYAQVQASEEIMQGVMMPRFRQGDPAGAVLQGATACAARIFGVSAPSKPAKAGALPQASPVPFRRSPPLILPRGVGFFLLFLALSSVAVGLIWLAVRPRHCPKCRTKMVLLSEEEDDAHLEPSERTEERIGSVNYNIWHCPGCGEIRKTRWGRLFSGYSACPGCHARTSASLSTTVHAATQSTTGLVRVIEHCAHCSHSRSYTYSTPLLAEPAEYGSSATSSSFSSSSSSSSFSSNSGSDGGHSSGGGASGRW